MSEQLETISIDRLAKVSGGTDGYTKEDVKNAGQGALVGARRGPLGALFGAAGGFMKRKAGELVDETRNLWNESQRSRQLDKQLQMLPKAPAPMQPAE